MSADLRLDGGARLEAAIAVARQHGRPALVGYVTGGFPDPDAFVDLLPGVAAEVDILEVGVPFSDPMADGVTIQRASERALAAGTTLAGLLDGLERVGLERPVVLMSYLNPVLQMGFDAFAARAAAVGVAGLIVPDVPWEESEELRAALDPAGVALVQLVTPLTPPERLARLCAASQGFVYAVTMTGTTGRAVADQRAEVGAYLDRVRATSPRPVLAGFGIRTPEDVRALGEHADGVIVGSAVVEAIERGDDAPALLRSLRGGRA
ncbi:MAG: tryptophan synthase subunit alpha [Gemmatimonadota bacterium]